MPSRTPSLPRRCQGEPLSRAELLAALMRLSVDLTDLTVRLVALTQRLDQA